MHYESVITDRYAQRSVSLEANFITDGIKSVLSYFPSMLSSISKGFSKADAIQKFSPTDEQANPIFLSKKEKQILELLASVPYGDLSKLRLYVPEGFKGNYCSYLLDAMAALDYHEQTCVPALENFYVHIASLITNKNDKLSLKDKTAEYKALENARNKTNEKLAAYFVARSSQSEQPYEVVFANNDEVQKTFLLNHRLTNTLKNVKVNEVTELTNKITDTLETIIKSAEDGNMSALSPAQLKNITEGAYEMASQVEFFAVNYYRCQVLINSILNFQPKLMQRLSN